MYATSEMNDGVLTTANMNRRYIEISHELDADSNAVVFLNRSAHIILTMQDGILLRVIGMWHLIISIIIKGWSIILEHFKIK